MKVLQINTVYGRGSVGRICLGIHDACRENGIECLTAYRFEEGEAFPDTLTTTSWLEGHVHNRLAWITGLQGFFSYFHTLRLVSKIKKIRPDLIQLHNLHGSYLNWAVLFRYLKKSGLPIVWELHDCTAFTGRCYHFTVSGCEKWKTACGSCPCIREFPAASVDLTALCYQKKKAWFTGVPRLQLVTPSEWMKGLIAQSFLREYPVQVFPNGINLSLFRPRESAFREEHGIGNRRLFLFVANVWNEKKGSHAIERFARLPEEKYAVCVVGCDEAFASELPKQVIAIRHTNNAQELAEIYTAADLFVNPTLEDTYPTVNMEALACGTPVLTYKTGGSPEMLDESCGCVVPYGDEEALLEAALRMADEKARYHAACLERAESFDEKTRFAEFVKLYQSLAEDGAAK